MWPDYTSSRADKLRTLSKTHSGDKSQKVKKKGEGITRKCCWCIARKRVRKWRRKWGKKKEVLLVHCRFLNYSQLQKQVLWSDLPSLMQIRPDNTWYRKGLIRYDTKNTEFGRNWDIRRNKCLLIYVYKTKKVNEEDKIRFCSGTT